MLIACALSLSLGWGIRGNFGHEYGAMIPGALAAMAAALLSGREDWWRRTAYFGLFGALGWSFGGSISYMHVIAYTHSGHLPSQCYGFACLFVIGFLWAALGGAGTSLPACLDWDRLVSIFPPMLVVLLAWAIQNLVIPLVAGPLGGASRHESWLYWYDTSWLAALAALAAGLIWALIRRRVEWGTSLVLHVAVGWWAGFLLVMFMVDGLGIEFRMTPPRGDNWAGVLGMTAGALLFFLRHRLHAMVLAMLITGIVGGLGFSAATFLKLVEIKYVPLVLSYLWEESAWQTNWHSILEQTYGLINGIGIALAIVPLARTLPRLSDLPQRKGSWAEMVAVAFVLLVIPYVNLVKILSTWIPLKAIPADLHGLPTRVWFDLGYALMTAGGLVLLLRHRRRRLALVPESSLGHGQLLYLVLLWVVVIGNLMRAVPLFQAERLVTEGVIYVNALLCSLLVVLWPAPLPLPDQKEEVIGPGTHYRLAGAALLTLIASTILATAGTRAIHGGAFVGHAGYHTRFGPDAGTGKPQKGLPHP
jgi:hypothetical protein